MENMEKETENERINLYDSDTSECYTEDEYRECCDIPEGEIDQNSYYSWVNDCQSNDWNEFKTVTDKYDGSIYITGSLGRWDGVHEIFPVYVGDNEPGSSALTRAISKCMGGSCSDIKIDLLVEEGALEVTVSHHDGTNTFYLRPLTKEGDSLASDIEMYGEDETYRSSDITFGKFKKEDFDS